MIGVERRVGVFVIGTLRCKSEHDAPFGIFPNALSIDYFLATLLHRAIEIDIGLIHTLEISLHDIVGSGVRFGDLIAVHENDKEMVRVKDRLYLAQVMLYLLELLLWQCSVHQHEHTQIVMLHLFALHILHLH